MMKRTSFSFKMRHSLSDITNFQSQEELNLHGSESNDRINQLMKENEALVKLLEKKDKTIESNRYVLWNLREGIQKLKLQNLSLAQSNSQFLSEINLARNKVKALHHEVSCKNALLKYKCCELEKVENTQPNALRTDNDLKKPKEDLSSQRSFVPNRRRYIRSKSLGASTEPKTETEKEKSETKRKQMRRKSARVRSVAHEVTENLFEIEDLQLTMLHNGKYLQDNSKIVSHTRKKEEKEEDVQTRHQDSKIREQDQPVDQPLRRAAEKIYL